MKTSWGVQTSWRVLFLIVVAAEGFHFAVWQTLLILVVYVVLEYFDQWLSKIAKTKAVGKAIDDVVYGWHTVPDDPTLEVKDEWSRTKLVGSEQILVARIAELLREMLR